MSSRFLSTLHAVGLVLLVLASFGCKPTGKATESTSEPHRQMPTASEVLNIRSECAKCGDLIMRENIIGIEFTQDVVTHYDSKTNRCYAQLTVQNANHDGKKITTYLYDGQTKDILAFIVNNKGNELLSVKFNPVGNYETSNLLVQEYISDKMEDKDYQARPEPSPK